MVPRPKPAPPDAHIAEQLRQLAHPVGDLLLLAGNPRRGDVEAVTRSLATFGQRKPIVAKRSDRTVIAGNHTLTAARQLGWATVAVVWVDDDEATAKAFALADNRTSDLGGYDDEALRAMLEQVSTDAELLAAASWSVDYLDDLTERLDVPDLADLAAKYGEHEPADHWPLIRLTVPPDVHEAWRTVVASAGGDEVEAFSGLLSRP